MINIFKYLKRFMNSNNSKKRKHKFKHFAKRNANHLAMLHLLLRLIPMKENPIISNNLAPLTRSVHLGWSPIS